MLILFLPPVELQRPVGRVSVCPNNKLERRRAQDYIVTTLYTTLHFEGGPRVESSRRLRLERKNTLQSSPPQPLLVALMVFSLLNLCKEFRPPSL